SNQLTAETGYTFGSIAVAGATPRSWYYMLRDADPTARFYSAIVIAVESYDDAEKWEVEANRADDLSYVIGHLRLSDLWEFSSSYQDPELQWKAARGILFKGLVYKRDLEDLLLHPVSRSRLAKLAHRDSFAWHYGYHGPLNSLSGFRVDWELRKLTVPPDADPKFAKLLESYLLDALPPETGAQSRYLKYWLGKTADRY